MFRFEGACHLLTRASQVIGVQGRGGHCHAEP
jgi:hypothetical protein